MDVAAPAFGSPPLKRYAAPFTVQGANPAAAAAFVQQIDDGYWWRLLTVSVRLNTDATAANRTLRVEYRDTENNVVSINGNPVTYPAATADEDFFFSVWHPRGEWEVATANIVPLSPMLLQPGWDWRIGVTNIQAGDTLTVIRFTVEKFYPPESGDYTVPGWGL